MQGEGVHSGTPSVFLRTYRCNLSCTWCDSKYTWLDQDKARSGVDYTPMPASAVIDKITSYGCKHLVLTGGEPLLHQRVLAPILAGLKGSGFFIEVETNGTIAPSAELEASVDCFNVSPKISNSLVEEGVRIRPDSLKAFVRSRKAWFKFVVCDQKDLAEIEGVVSKFGLPRDRVILDARRDRYGDPSGARQVARGRLQGEGGSAFLSASTSSSLATRGELRTRMQSIRPE